MAYLQHPVDRAINLVKVVSSCLMALFHIVTVGLIAAVHGTTTALVAAVIMAAIHIYYRITP